MISTVSWLRQILIDEIATALILITGEKGPIPLNEAARQQLDSTRLGADLLSLSGPLGNAVRHSLVSGEPLSFYGPLGVKGSVRHVLASGRPVQVDGLEPALLLELCDAAPFKVYEEVLQHQIDSDALTGVASRRRFFEEGKRLCAEARRHDHPFGVLLIDLDRFKAINDTFGHSAGDRVLIKACRLWQRNLRQGDLLGRLGGEEFGVLLPHATLEGAAIVAERMRHDLRLVRRSGVVNHSVTASLGVAVSTPKDAAFERILDRADHALYAAKAERNRVRTQEG